MAMPSVGAHYLIEDYADNVGEAIEHARRSHTRAIIDRKDRSLAYWEAVLFLLRQRLLVPHHMHLPCG